LKGEVIMPKARKIKEETNMDDKQISMEEEIIDRFILRKDSDASGENDYYSFPVMMRLDINHIARLDHLAKIWRIKRSSLARQMLEEMIHLVMDRYYRDKTPEEYKMIQREAYDDILKKIETIKKKKKKKE
jgi:hypothetical protein